MAKQSTTQFFEVEWRLWSEKLYIARNVFFTKLSYSLFISNIPCTNLYEKSSSQDLASFHGESLKVHKHKGLADRGWPSVASLKLAMLLAFPHMVEDCVLTKKVHLDNMKKVQELRLMVHLAVDDEIYK